MGYIDWNEIIRDIKKISRAKLQQLEIVLQSKKNRTELEEVALNTVLIELEIRNGV